MSRVCQVPGPKWALKGYIGMVGTTVSCFLGGRILSAACIASRQADVKQGYVLSPEERAEFSEEDQGRKANKPLPPVLAHLIKRCTVLAMFMF